MPKWKKDGKGGAIIAWQDERNGTYDIFAQRLDAQGNRKWGIGGVPVCIAQGTQTVPKIDPDSLTDGAYVVWVDKRSGEQDIYAQRIDSNGAPMWAANGIPVCTATGNQSAQDIMSNDNISGLFVTWKDERNGNYDIYAQKINPTGTMQWAANGIAVCTSFKDQLNPNIITDNGTGAIIVWQDSSGNGYDIKAQRLTAAGALMWPAVGVAVGTASGAQTDPKNVSDGKGGTIIAFADQRGGIDKDIYAHHLASDGTTTINDINVFSAIGSAPNPFKDEMTITAKLEKDEPLTISVFDITGREVTQQWSIVINRLNGSSYQVRVSIKDGLSATGVYYIKLSTPSGYSTVKAMKY